MSKFITIIIIIVLAISLTACGDNTPTPAQSASEPSSSAVSVVGQTSSTEPEASEPESSSESEASSEAASSSESASSAVSSAAEASSSTADMSSTSSVPAKPTTFLSSLTDDQFAELLYGMRGDTKLQAVEYIWDVSVKAFEDEELYAAGDTANLSFPDTIGEEVFTIGRDVVPADVIDNLSKRMEEECTELVIAELDRRGPVYIKSLWFSENEYFFALMQDKFDEVQQTQ